jgi:hypothetical protein
MRERGFHGEDTRELHFLLSGLGSVSAIPRPLYFLHTNRAIGIPSRESRQSNAKSNPDRDASARADGAVYPPSA